uniref:E3 ubiquitin-protein ligase MYLIP n=1 Tax=Lygus hesperus TaxID=30085 RepID=A0A0A9XNF0_LYGHE
MQMQSVSDDSLPASIKSRLQTHLQPIVSNSELTSVYSATQETGVKDMFYFPLRDTRNAIATFRNVIELAQHYRFETITEGVIASAHDLDFNLVAYYIAKHTLNCIRQLGGYKNGSYVKVKAGVEDNVLLHDCICNIACEEVLDESSHTNS